MALSHLLLARLQQLRVPLPLDQLLLLLRLGVGLDGEATLQHGVVPAKSRSHKCGKPDRLDRSLSAPFTLSVLLPLLALFPLSRSPTLPALFSPLPLSCHLPPSLPPSPGIGYD